MEDNMAIKQLSREEKLRVMEAIWEDLSSEDQSLPSPEGHEVVLK